MLLLVCLVQLEHILIKKLPVRAAHVRTTQRLCQRKRARFPNAEVSSELSDNNQVEDPNKKQRRIGNSPPNLVAPMLCSTLQSWNLLDHWDGALHIVQQGILPGRARPDILQNVPFWFDNRFLGSTLLIIV